MAHKLFGTRFTSAREPAWHGIGLSWQGPMTAADAIARTRADEVRIETREMGYRTQDGTFIPAGDRTLIVRLPTPDDPAERILGQATDAYRVMQNTEIGRMLDASKLTDRWPVETCGVLDDGATLFLCLALGDSTIASEPHKRYCLLTDKRDGVSALQVLTVHTRVVCANTLQIALNEGDEKLNITHRDTMQSDLEVGLRLMHSIDERSEHTRRCLESLHELEINTERMEHVLDQTYPKPRAGTLLRQYERMDDPSQFTPATLARLEKLADQHSYLCTLRETIRSSTQDRYGALCEEYPHLGGTGLGLYNAVAEVADHTRTRGHTLAGVTGTRAEEKIRCYTALTTLMAEDN